MGEDNGERGVARADKTEMVEFVGALADIPTAIKFDGRGDGGKVTFEFDRSQVGEVAKLLLHTEKLLRVRIEPEE